MKMKIQGGDGERRCSANHMSRLLSLALSENETKKGKLAEQPSLALHVQERRTNTQKQQTREERREDHPRCRDCDQNQINNRTHPPETSKRRRESERESTQSARRIEHSITAETPPPYTSTNDDERRSEQETQSPSTAHSARRSAHHPTPLPS
jgi:hypothetical protein